jgi:NADH-quinone oxidoreductase subunit C
VNHPGVLETTDALGETTMIVYPARIVDVSLHLKHEHKFNRICSITAVDWHPAEPRFEVVYHLHSVDPKPSKATPAVRRLRLKCRISGINPEIDSVTRVWRGADWYERETFDMFGIRFRNHPNLTRILMPLDWEGYPLRKDYPTHGYKYSYKGEEPK